MSLTRDEILSQLAANRAPSREVDAPGLGLVTVRSLTAREMLAIGIEPGADGQIDQAALNAALPDMMLSITAYGLDLPATAEVLAQLDAMPGLVMAVATVAMELSGLTTKNA